MRAIDADEFEKQVCEYCGIDCEGKGHKPMCACGYMLLIDAMPTLDVQSVIHAEWVSHNPKNPSKNFHCSNCLGLVEMPYYTYDCYYKYCPNCGAKNGR